MGEKALSTSTVCTLSGAVVGERFVSPCCVVSALAGIVFVKTPVLVATTFTRTIQFGLGATVALFKVIVFPPGVALSEAAGPQSCSAFTGRGGSAMTTFAGKVSASEVCVREINGSVLLIVIVSTLGSPTNTVFGEKDLLSEGESI